MQQGFALVLMGQLCITPDISQASRTFSPIIVASRCQLRYTIITNALVGASQHEVQTS